MRRRTLIVAGLTGAAGLSGVPGVTGCSTPEEPEPGRSPDPDRTTTPSERPGPTPTDNGPTDPGGSPEPTDPDPDPSPSGPRAFELKRARQTVRRLATGIGPREATSEAFAAAAELVAREFRAAGYRVNRQPVTVPAGLSWGVEVPAGDTVNVIAAPPSQLPATAGARGEGVPVRPHLVVGAHLDTVPQAPGAEDNASGVAVLLELARMAAGTLPVVFVAFGAEEPRGEGNDNHHFGSRAYVRKRDTGLVRGMVSLDRVGTGERVRIRTGGRASGRVAEALRSTARELRIPTTNGEDRASDHWSFEKAGVAAARVGGNAYAGYHNERDTPELVRDVQLRHTARVVWRWISESG